ncbi:hypothetical protein E2C01_050220 [Portunus trituberculatus]|uniref:CCHC-type domain-containing protein n=1 Tax=Portunus trituberculatus TaxID=210409 RepID=A0A5B7GG47_PORTR|nr:hypothetical protein [Portunus trituberculatus]
MGRFCVKYPRPKELDTRRAHGDSFTRMEKHSTKECPKSQGYTCCSECGSEGYFFKDCRTEIKKCMHCNGPHSCRAMRCPVRKAEQKRKQERSRQVKEDLSTSFVQATQTATNPHSVPIGIAAADSTTINFVRRVDKT